MSRIQHFAVSANIIFFFLNALLISVVNYGSYEAQINSFPFHLHSLHQDAQSTFVLFCYGLASLRFLFRNHERNSIARVETQIKKCELKQMNTVQNEWWRNDECLVFPSNWAPRRY